MRDDHIITARGLALSMIVVTILALILFVAPSTGLVLVGVAAVVIPAIWLMNRGARGVSRAGGGNGSFGSIAYGDEWRVDHHRSMPPYRGRQ